MELIIISLINLILLVLIIYLLYLIKNKYNKYNKIMAILKELCDYITEENKRINNVNDNVIAIYKAFVELINICKEKYQDTVKKSNSDKKAKFSSKSNSNPKQDISAFKKNDNDKKLKISNRTENKQ